MTDTWQQQLVTLLAGDHSTTGDPLDAGARLVVHDPDGTEAFRAPLARTARHDAQFPGLWWIRPIVGGYRDPDTGRRLYNLSLARRRGLDVTAARTDNAAVILQLRGGQVARIEPAGGAELEELHSWDDFTLQVLTAEELTALEATDADGWHGRFA